MEATTPMVSQMMNTRIPVRMGWITTVIYSPTPTIRIVITTLEPVNYPFIDILHIASASASIMANSPSPTPRTKTPFSWRILHLRCLSLNLMGILTDGSST